MKTTLRKVAGETERSYVFIFKNPRKLGIIKDLFQREDLRCTEWVSESRDFVLKVEW